MVCVEYAGLGCGLLSTKLGDFGAKEGEFGVFSGESFAEGGYGGVFERLFVSYTQK